MLNNDGVKVLIVSHNALAKENANAVVLCNLLRQISQENIAQVFIKDDKPTDFVKSSFYKITDKDRLKGFFNSKTHGTIVVPPNNTSEINFKKSKNKGSFLSKISSLYPSLLFREFIWKHGKFDYDHLYSWIHKFNPNVIVFVPGRSIFLNDLVEKIAERFSLPVMLFTTEDEYFHKKPLSIFGRIHLKRLKQSYKSVIKNCVSRLVLVHEDLTQLYQREFGLDCTTIMMPSSQTRSSYPYSKSNKLLVYAGNVDRGRIDTLIKVSKSLFRIDRTLRFTVVPGFASRGDYRKLRKQKNVKIIDFLPYDEYIDLLKRADLIFNVDTFLKKYNKITTQTFTGKTADLLRLGRPLCVVAPEYIYTNKYFRKNSGCCELISDLTYLDDGLKHIIYDEEYRKACAENAYLLSLKNHDLLKNSERFKDEIDRVSKDGFKHEQN